MHTPRKGPLLSIIEAAKYLGISPGTLRNWLSVRKLAFVKIGRLTKLAQADLDAFIATNTIKGFPA